nr:hypothetical protein [Azospirillum doebereinerae]
MRGGHPVLWLEERPGTARELPAWMCDAAYCLDMAMLVPPQVAITALSALAAVLSELRRQAGDPAASDIPSLKEVADAQTTAADAPALAEPQRSVSGRHGSGRGDPGSGGPAPGSRGRPPIGRGSRG